MHAVGTGRTDIGKQRKRNEDRHFIDNDLGLFIVADGMGGHAAGDLAAQIAVDVASTKVESKRSTIERVRRGKESPEELVTIARQAIEEASREVFEKSRSDIEFAGMGCTMTILLVDGHQAAMAHVGDTRLYLLRNEEVHQLSADHTLAAELAKMGAITAEQAVNHHYAHVLSRSVGNQAAAQVDTLLLDIAPGDRFLLCSDGLTNYVKDTKWFAEQLASEDLEEIPDLLIDFANSEGGGDNISIVIASIELDPAEKPIVVSLGNDVQVKLEALSSVFIFEDLGLAKLARLINASVVLDYNEGVTLVEAGSELSRMLVVAEGLVEVTRDGKVIAELGPGDHVGASTLLVSRPAGGTLRTVEPSRLLSLESTSFQELVRRRPWLGVELLERLGRELARELNSRRTSPMAGHEQESGSELSGLV